MPETHAACELRRRGGVLCTALQRERAARPSGHTFGPAGTTPTGTEPRAVDEGLDL
jgi:hypothetical protein